MPLLLSLQSALRPPRCVAVRLRAVVPVFNVDRKWVHQVHSQAELHRLRAMAQRLLQQGCKPLRVVLQAAPPKGCVQLVRVLVDLADQGRVGLVDQAERRSHQLRYVSSQSWVTCSYVDRSM